MRNQLLYITSHKLSDNNGGANCSKFFVNAFAKLFDDCSIIFPAFDEPHAVIPSKYKQYPCFDKRCKIKKGIDMYMGVVSALYAFIIKHIKIHSYKIIVIDHSVTGTSLVKILKATGAKLITIHHNVEKDYLKDNGAERPIIYRYAYNYYALKSEKECLENSDINITLTEKDASVFRTWYKAKDIHAYCVSSRECINIPRKELETKTNGYTFAITGSLSFIQSVSSILLFLEKYYPVLKKCCPDCSLLITGRNPAPILVKKCDIDPTIKLIPNPIDINSVIKQADFYICPINKGSGMKQRVMDGLRQGLTILCHEVSVYGYENFEKEQFLYRYNDEKSFKSSVEKLTSNRKPKSVVYEKFRKEFSFDTGVTILREILTAEKMIPKDSD